MHKIKIVHNADGSTSRKIVRSSREINTRKYVKAADGDLPGSDFDDIDLDDDAGEGIADAIDDVSDNLEDIEKTVNDVKEDRVDVAVNNNILDHYIAECENCQNIFISAVIQSTENIDHVRGICPICKEETDQYLKWIIKDAKEV